MYRENKELRLKMKSFAALPFVPSNLVLHYFEVFSDDIPTELEPWYEYFEDNYLRRSAVDNNAHLIFPLKCDQCTSEQSLDFNALTML